MMFHNFPITLLLVLAGISTVAAAPSVEKAVLGEYGIFEEQRDGAAELKTTSAGYLNRTASQRLVEKKDSLVGQIDTSFGITYVVSGAPEGADIKLRIRLIHPPLTNPATGETSTIDEHVADAVIGGPNYDGFTFENQWEIDPGKWTFQVYSGPDLLLEKTFTVSTP